MPPSRTKARPPRAAAKHTFSYQLREIIEARGLTAYAVAKLADVDPSVVGRFLRDERGLTTETLDRLISALDLRLVEVAARGRGRPRKAGPDHSSPLQSTQGHSGVEWTDPGRPGLPEAAEDP